MVRLRLIRFDGWILSYLIKMLKANKKLAVDSVHQLSEAELEAVSGGRHPFYEAGLQWANDPISMIPCASVSMVVAM
ncbi:hypothetical protein [Pseudomonas syringae]|uniref:hypothetical protein n=1 Tax=Pseudomonas syringae TaxID=317 RepID=UPI00051786A4|nr:hypothetical protein [Pseudomonas syringae]